MKAIKNYFFLLIISASLIQQTSCCKGKHQERALVVEFENFDFSILDTVMFIETDRYNTNDHFDTTLYDVGPGSTYQIFLEKYGSSNSSFIIKSLSPVFEHRITEINIDKATPALGCSKMIIEFKLDGTEYNKGDLITIEP